MAAASGRGRGAIPDCGNVYPSENIRTSGISGIYKYSPHPRYPPHPSYYIYTPRFREEGVCLIVILL